jgi:hypothetical protein
LACVTAVVGIISLLLLFLCFLLLLLLIAIIVHFSYHPHHSSLSDIHGCLVCYSDRILKSALLKVNSKIVSYVMNPKAMPRQQLLGHIDMDTREWFDGVLTYSSRQVPKKAETELRRKCGCLSFFFVYVAFENN